MEILSRDILSLEILSLEIRSPEILPPEILSPEIFSSETASGRRPLMPSFVNYREFSLIPREFRASVPPCTAPAALHFQGDPQTDAAAAAEGFFKQRQDEML